MASPVPNVPNPTSARHLDAYKVALELVEAAGELLPSFARFDTSLASQLKNVWPEAPTGRHRSSVPAGRS